MGEAEGGTMSTARDIPTDKVVEDYLNGCILHDLATNYKVGRKRISAILHAAGVCRSRGGAGRPDYRPLPASDGPEVVRRYQEGLSGVELAETYKVSLWEIYGVLRKRGIALRTTSEAGRVTQNRPELKAGKSRFMRRLWVDRKQKLAAGEAALKAAKPKPVGRRREPESAKRYFKIGQAVEKEIPTGQKQDKHSIIQARRRVSDRTHHEFDVVAQYHKRFRRFCTENGVELPA